ncbi:metalloregulator ArsR/SmtB family transcription factor [Bacillus horti]|uniref:Biotin operon repressor n=1 Tax=Caldalkalibacillus horti TaxID=77523 RepID=A0ABT9W0J1_9BACI|nr:metalloregulator ArsR/SmtB family transcription factor [Bacillus horti]MDQ0166778.1 biotin operon repressor [Bacillus horti]
MQLNRLVSFHKALADPIRIKILSLLAASPLHGQALASKLGVTPPTITHHMHKLRDVGLVKERRDKNTIYYHLQLKTLEQNAQAILNTVTKRNSTREDEKEMRTDLEKEKITVLSNFISPEGKLKTIPAQRKKKLIIFEYLVKKLKVGQKYTEKEINEFIKQFHEDCATIRREFIINHFMYREDGIYEVNPEELWAKID